ncbi:ATP-dependent metallopeptidase HflB [Propionibacterium sp. oral taxon 192 str. F0372]|uniref:ATP-dependent zinc metalloprotease FtsH n=1 Tax=Propionibacterium sp. oral taxon 192 TaxID=671222 RepID=UPI0003529187|nr:ATP-dependent zinc metalloprotease FtsH [Propionibacterium sp. oral taxon 192]EPH00225.1 ATP-dependent metallopeptidase HflB [Propionibacterium sp. oral taxon 192 str. F0372]
MSQSHPAQNKDATEHTSGARRPNRSDAPSRRPPLDAPRPWKTEGLPTDKSSKSDKDKQHRSPRRWIFWVVSLFALFAVWGFLSWQDARSAPPAISYSEFTAQVKAGNVKEIYSRGDTIEGKLRAEASLPDDGNEKTAKQGNYTQFTTERPTFAQDDLLSNLAQHDATVSATPVVDQRGPVFNLIFSLVVWGLLIGALVWMLRRISKTTGGLGGFGMQRQVKPVEKTKVRVNFADVAGIDEVKDQVDEIVDFLRNPDKYRRVGARAPRGILLEGQPGTGKTLLARATAGEAEVPFFSASASEFIEMIVGVGAQRVRQLFDEAQKVAPAIVFIDEIDAIGRARGSSRASGSNDEREQTLNQILTEMDGFDGTEGVVVMAATNRSDVLDPALTRPGRFDRVITVSAPDQKGREKILEVHTREIPMDASVSLTSIAKSTPGATGADLANLANEAALRAARRGDSQVNHSDFTDALETIQLGVARSVLIPDEEKRRTAYHEGGHALLGMLQKGADPVRKVSIIPRGQALGVTLSTPDTDRYGYDEQYLRGRIVGALGGMAAEAAVYGVVTTGAESDLRQATAIARQMVGKWGMSQAVGPITVLFDDMDPHQVGVSDATLAVVDTEVRKIISECHDRAVAMLTEHRPKLDAIADALMEHETLDEEQVYRVAGIERHDPSSSTGLNTPVPHQPVL